MISCFNQTNWTQKEANIAISPKENFKPTNTIVLFQSLLIYENCFNTLSYNNVKCIPHANYHFKIVDKFDITQIGIICLLSFKLAFNYQTLSVNTFYIV